MIAFVPAFLESPPNPIVVRYNPELKFYHELNQVQSYLQRWLIYKMPYLLKRDLAKRLLTD